MEIHNCDWCGNPIRSKEWGLYTEITIGAPTGGEAEEELCMELCSRCRVNFAAEVKAIVERMKKT